MQRTADVHDPIAGARLPQAAHVVDDATALDAAVDMLDAHATSGDASIRGLLRASEVSGRLRGLRVGMMISTRSSVNAKKPSSWRNRLPTGKG